ncbi:MAG: TolC family protein [Gemmatimonadota bacterium]
MHESLSRYGSGRSGEAGRPGGRFLHLLAGGVLCAAWLVGAVVPASAQQPGRARQVRLSLESAVRRATTLNEVVLMARAEQARAEGIATETRADALPEVTANVNYTRNVQRPVLFFNTPNGVQQISIGDDNDYTFGLSLKQPLLDFSLGPARKAAGLSRRASSAQVESARVAAALQARLDYYTVLLDRALVRVQEQALEQAAARLKEVEAMNRAGTAADFDLLTAQVEVENIRPQLIEARNRLELDGNRLKRTVNLPIATELVLTDSLERPPPPAPERAEAESVAMRAAVKHAMEHRADLEAQELVVDLQSQNLSAQRSDALPSFDLLASLSRRGSSSQFFPSEEDFSQSLTAGLQVSIPLFDGRARAGRVQQARAALDRERYRLRQLSGDVQLEVQQARQALGAARAQAEASESNVRRAERALKIAQTRFRNGLSTQVELNDSELAVTRARTNYAQALFNYNVAQARLVAAMGER